ncbi:hypothetical protein ACXHQJ_23070, partial [Vibrio vulnificus]
VLLYIVYSHTKAGLSVPIWVLAEPWPNKSVKDRMNRLIAESIAAFFKIVVIICLLIKQLLFLDLGVRHQLAYSS